MSYIIYPVSDKVKLHVRGYFKRGDEGKDIAIISTFLATNFMGYEYKTKVKIDDMLGSVYGPNLEKWIKLFQKNNNIKVDGLIDRLTLAKLGEYGLDI